MRLTVLFDLDGTLTDPGVGITRSVAYALERVGAAPMDGPTLRRFIGPPLQDGFALLAGLSPVDVDLAVAAYREYFTDRGIYENVVYDGIPQVLQQLRDGGVTLGLATSKPTVFASRILQHFALAPFFRVVAGAELDGSRRHKSDVIAYALGELGIQPGDEDTVLMVGDREHDVVGAAEQGITCIGVTWGYGTREELQAAGAHALVDTPDQLLASITTASRPAAMPER